MEDNRKRIIYTIGHSTHTINEFIAMLEECHINVLVDVRRFPSSSKYPQFNREELQQSLERSNIQYIYMDGLGGRRKMNSNSKNNRWKSDLFRAYADYMETAEFDTAIHELENITSKDVIAIMCSESLWWRCHRSMIADYLKAKHWKVFHIMGLNKIVEHTFTSPAIVVENRVYYSDGYSEDQKTKDNL